MQKAKLLAEVQNTRFVTIYGNKKFLNKVFEYFQIIA